MTRVAGRTGLERVASLVGNAPLEAVLAEAVDGFSRAAGTGHAFVARRDGCGTPPPPEAARVVAEAIERGTAVRVDTPPRSAVALPVVVAGVPWGALGVHASRPLPDGIEAAGAEYAALVAAAVACAAAEAAARRLAEEQAALRNVAMRVARQAPPGEIFGAVVQEVARALGLDGVRLLRYDPDGAVTPLASWPDADPQPGARIPADADSVIGRVHRTGRFAGSDDHQDLPGAPAADRGDGVTAGAPILLAGHQDLPGAPAADRGDGVTAGAPILLAGRPWGVLLATRRSDGLPADLERRLEEFTALLGTAIADMHARAEVERLADEQAALRRVATLVARHPSPEDVFATVVEEVGRLLPVDAIRLVRFELDGTATMVSSYPADDDIPAGFNHSLDGDMLSTRIRRAWGPARFDDYGEAMGTFAAFARARGTHAAAGAPIIVGGRMWGTLIATSATPRSLPPGIEHRIERFTALVANAIANVEARDALAASRDRILAATDAARRRFERDLHDGAQQGLVTLAVELRLAETEVPEPARARIARAVERAEAVLDELRELSRGLHPAILSEGGLRPALRALARRSAVPVKLTCDVGERFDDRVEVAAYYVVSESLANAAKHARASRVEVSVGVRDERLRIAIRDDGAGGADAARGSGLISLKDRVEALEGAFVVVSPPGGGTTVTAELPPLSR